MYNVTASYICKNYSGCIEVEKSEGRDARFFKLSDLPSNISDPVRPIINDYIKRVGMGKAL